ATLTMTTLGTFVIKVSTPINGVYNRGEHTLIITVNKLEITPTPTVEPTVKPTEPPTLTPEPTVPIVTPTKEPTAKPSQAPTQTPIGEVKPQVLPVGTKCTADDGTAIYKITVSDIVNGTVTYVAPANKKAATVNVPDTVVISGVTYKVTAIEKKAFSGCKKLNKVTIGKNVAKIGAKAFYGCSKLETLIIKTTKLTVKKVGSKVFGKTPKKMTVKVPKKKFNAYKKMLIKRGVNKKAKFKKN
ncbi:MAG: hypothetical protein E7265_08095, partial [Lachnospiraceae bacterium]|nr:hypothetical protein [Lachnospiraceae bacterium]